tara:strand:- start:33663 stop:33803 length:141 start_codon:yes stop_codon:yes gene_type:complete
MSDLKQMVREADALVADAWERLAEVQSELRQLENELQNIYTQGEPS